MVHKQDYGIDRQGKRQDFVEHGYQMKIFRLSHICSRNGASAGELRAALAATRSFDASDIKNITVEVDRYIVSDRSTLTVSLRLPKHKFSDN